jgi:hypothetical protein
MPCPLDRKYPPVDASWVRLWAFPWVTLSADPGSRLIRRHHALDRTFQRALDHSVRRTARQGRQRAHSAQAEESQHEQDDHDGADEPDDSVHDAIPSG